MNPDEIMDKALRNQPLSDEEQTWLDGEPLPSKLGFREVVVILGVTFWSCPKCFALVESDSARDHADWHQHGIVGSAETEA